MGILEALGITKNRRRYNRTTESIEHCPWPKDIHIDTYAFINLDDGRPVYYVSAAADGPNPGDTMHHSSIGYWPDFGGFESMNKFAISLQHRIYTITGYVPPIYDTHAQQEQEASWCLGYNGATRPAGTDPNNLITEIEEYDE
jgi:hypothetical protein